MSKTAALSQGGKALCSGPEGLTEAGQTRLSLPDSMPSSGLLGHQEHHIVYMYAYMEHTHTPHNMETQNAGYGSMPL